MTQLRKANPNLRVMVAGDKKVPYGEMVELLDIVRSAGIQKASLEVKTK